TVRRGPPRGQDPSVRVGTLRRRRAQVHRSALRGYAGQIPHAPAAAPLPLERPAGLRLATGHDHPARAQGRAARTTGETDVSKVIAITGAARGIGFATAKALKATGAKVAIGDIDEAAVQEAGEKLGVPALRLDVTDRESFDAFLAAAEDGLG